MERDVTFLQDIQDAYSVISDLTIFITDKHGSIITNVSNENLFTDMILNEFGENDKLHEIIKPLNSIKTPILLDSRIGLKLILAPIPVNNDLKYYIFAGYMLEQGSKEFVYQFIKENVNESNQLLGALNTLTVYSDNEIREKLKHIEKLATVISTNFSIQDKELKNSQTLSILHNSLESIRKDSVTYEEILREFMSINKSVDFVGLALEDEYEQYKVEVVQGQGAEKLKGHTFLIGEGFFGHTIAVKSLQFWKNSSIDPRSNLFIQKGMDSQSLFCIPIYAENLVKGVLFGGSFHRELEASNVVEDAKLFSSLLSTLISKQKLNEDLQNHLMELSTFNEIFHVITSVEDIKRVLYILVDISLNLIRGPFTCIVFRPDTRESKVEIVSRGLTKDQINDYCHDVSMRSFSNSMIDNVKQPKRILTNWGPEVLEFPLVFNDHLYGMLCVGYYPKDDPDKYISYLSSLSVSGGIAIHLQQMKSGKENEDSILQLLHATLEQLAPEKYQQTVKIKKLVEEFTHFYYPEQMEQLSKASYVALYEIDVLKKFLADSSIISLLQECKAILNNAKTNSNSGEILAVVCHYVNHGENPEALTTLNTISDNLRTQFLSYLTKQTIVESQVSLIDHLNSSSYTQSIKKDAAFLKNELNISSRENEVLNLVLKGYSNQEIASKLYISDHTVKNHMTKILQKLGATDRSQAIAKVYQMGYTPID